MEVKEWVQSFEVPLRLGSTFTSCPSRDGDSFGLLAAMVSQRRELDQLDKELQRFSCDLNSLFLEDS